MTFHADFKDAECSMSMTMLAEESGIKNRETASRIVKPLVVAGIVEPVGSQSHGRISTRYRFTFTVNRDSGVTVKSPRNSPNRDSGVTVKPESTVTPTDPNRDSKESNRDSAPPRTPLTVTGESHKGISKELPKEEREGSAPRSLAPQAQISGKSKAPREVTDQDIAVVQRACADIKNQPADDSVRKLLERYTADVVANTLKAFHENLPERSQNVAELLFFRKRGGVAVVHIERHLAKQWKANLGRIAENATTPAAVDDWVRRNPPPTECVANIDKLVNAAKGIQKQAVEVAAVREKEIAENGGTDFAEDAADLVALVNKYPGARKYLHFRSDSSFNVSLVEMYLRSAAKTLGHPLEWEAILTAVG
jgi:hypothetical protein